MSYFFPGVFEVGDGLAELGDFDGAGSPGFLKLGGAATEK
jgi:hypothetical protein